MSGSRLYVITGAMMLSLFMASIESTVVATAMPTIVAQLGGLEIYAWVFSAFMLTSTTMVPIFGKLSDIYGRRTIYLVAMTLFLVGSVLCALAQDMTQLIFFRALQGLGAGGLQPLAFTIIGDIFSFEQRARVQGLFSGMWGLSSIIGPLIGGFLVDQVSWHWVFWLNLPFGFLAAGLMIWAWRDVTPRHPGSIDFVGAGLLSACIIIFMFALSQLNAGSNFSSTALGMLFALAFGLLIVLIWVERRVEHPILPIPLFRERLFSVAIGHGFLSGFALFGTASFIPFFVESVLGTSATQAGATLTPQLLAWVAGSIIGTRLLLRFAYRSLVMVGMTLLVIGAAIMVIFVSASSPQWVIMLCGGLMGLGMGLSVPAFLIAVQSSVPRQSLGTATATVQFSRSIGGAIGVSVMGVILASRMASAFVARGLDPQAVSLDALIESSATIPIEMLTTVRESLAFAMQGVFFATLVAACLAWIVAMLAPPARLGERTPAPVQAEPVSGE